VGERVFLAGSVCVDAVLRRAVAGVGACADDADSAPFACPLHTPIVTDNPRNLAETVAGSTTRNGSNQMAGNGPPPKDSSKRARRNTDVVPLRTLTAVASPQPELPTRYRPVSDGDGATFSDIVDWPTATREWWEMWGRSPFAPSFTETDWSELQIAAFLHAEFMEGNYKLASELRLRTAKFGATPEDRLRLRVTLAFAQNTEADTEVKVEKLNSRDRLKGIQAAS